MRTLSAALVGCTLLLAPLAATAAGRGPSTPEERKQALEYIHRFQADPLNPSLKPEIQWVIRWTIEIPDVHINICTILDKLPKGDKKNSQTLFTAMIFAQTAFVLQNPDKQDDAFAQYQAGVEGVLRVYETLLRANPKDRQTYLDDLIQRREAGTLAQFVKERAQASCKN
ncbi:MAG: hypothetical protein ABSE99_09695 [Terracidiphilus sp.]